MSDSEKLSTLAWAVMRMFAVRLLRQEEPLSQGRIDDLNRAELRVVSLCNEYLMPSPIHSGPPTEGGAS